MRTTYTVVDRGVPTAAQANVLPFGCAYAISDDLQVEDPRERWVRCSIGAVFVRRDLADLDLTRIDLTMRWLVNPVNRYIIGGYLDVLLAEPEPVTVTVTYVQPKGLSCGHVIPFRGTIALDLLPGSHSVPFTGTISPSGAGSFTVGRS